MKFDMTAAWNEAMRLIAANRHVLPIVAGVFFFLPYAAFMLLFSREMEALQAAHAANPDPQALTGAMMSFYGSIWWVFALIAVFQGIGMLGLLALLTDRARPTVGQALGIGAKLLLPYLAAQILSAILMGIIMAVPMALAIGVSVPVGVLVGLLAVVALVYLFTKFVLVAPVIAIERVANPVAALGRSWRLTKGNSFRLFLFIFLILLAVGIVGGVASMIVGVVFALLGKDVASVGQAIVSGAINAAWITVFLAVLAAVHRQLAGPSPERIGQTFD